MPQSQTEADAERSTRVERNKDYEPQRPSDEEHKMRRQPALPLCQSISNTNTAVNWDNDRCKQINNIINNNNDSTCVSRGGFRC